MNTALEAGSRAEARVFAALAALPAPWRVFPTVEWRLLAGAGGEIVGEADAVVYHPQHGVIVFEVKAVAAVDFAGGNAHIHHFIEEALCLFIKLLK